nr:MAG TPA: hypothetical protein [Herelleviridae sp.]
MQIFRFLKIYRYFAVHGRKMQINFLACTFFILKHLQNFAVYGRKIIIKKFAQLKNYSYLCTTKSN